MTTIPVLDAAQAASWDEHARVAAHIPSRVLMEAAGRSVAQVIARDFGTALHRGVLVVAGHGNNGGDGWVAARALQALGVRVYAVDEDRRRSRDCEANRKLALSEGVVRLGPAEAWPAAGVVVDAILGTGASGPPRGSIGELAHKLVDCGAPVVAVDGPTGLDLTTGEAHGPVVAAVTVTFGGVRRGHLLQRSWCGRVVVAEIGFPPAFPEWPVLVEDRWAGAALPPFQAQMHKGDRGRVLVIGGDHGMAGAAIHAATTALASGAGLAKIAAHEVTIQAAQERLPDALTVLTALGPEIEDGLADAIEWADALVLGPGLGRGSARQALVQAILERADKPVVIDADALHSGFGTLTAGTAPRVLTPHPGEFRVAFPDLADHLGSDRFTAASAAADTLAEGTAAPDGSAGSVVLLKGVPTIIARAGSAPRVVAAGNPALATGGSGDLLAGFIASFLAQRLSPLDAAALGAHVMGRAAEIASEGNAVRSTRPGDVTRALPRLWGELANPPAVRPPVLIELEPPALV
ncbi:MAG: NAD(P)H-hydrate dehydratase [Gemmatimonadota bacterium]|nr:MAG: NAD(P)H-hydrate dehydratase [Gemmatimonadota bacterium]